MWQIVTPPTYSDAVSLDDAKDFMKVDETDENALIQNMVAASARLAEDYTGRRFLTQTWDYFLDDFINESGGRTPWWNGMKEGPEDYFFGFASRYIQIDQVPLQSVSFIKYFDKSNAEATFDSASYFVDSISTPARIVLNDGYSWPTGLRRYNAFQVRCVVGYGAAAAIPEPIQMAIMTQAQYMFLNRHDSQLQLQLCAASEGLLLPYRVMKL